MTETNQVVETKEAPFQMAVSVVDQQKAALYGIASVLVGVANIHGRKSMKRVVKTLRKQLFKSMGATGAKELMYQNKGAIEMAFTGIRKYPQHTVEQKASLTKMIVADLMQSYTVGVEKVLGGQS